METMEEKTSLERAIEESPLTVNNKDPKFVYRWVNQKRVDERKNRGWVVVESKSAEVPVGLTHASEGTKRFETLVLMKRPRELHDEARQKQQRRVKEQLDTVQKNFEEEGDKNKIKVLKGKDLEK